MTPTERQAQLLSRRRQIKVLTPGEPEFHSWIDGCATNAMIIDTIYLTLTSGGRLENSPLPRRRLDNPSIL